MLNDDANGHRLRMRVARLPERAFKPGIIQPQNPPHGPWMYPAWVSDGPSDFRTSGYQPPTNPSGVAVSQGSLSTTDDLVCTVATASTSPADPVKPIEHEYTWTTSDGAKTVIHTTSNLAADTLSSAETTKVEVWTCTVRGWDGAQFSHLSAANTAPAILNTPP